MFIETPRFPETISYGAVGGPGYSTDVATVGSGFESRNQNWVHSRSNYDVAHGVKSKADMDSLIAFFRNCKGRANAFRFKDWADFQTTVADGVLGTGLGTGLPTYQLGKVYPWGTYSETRLIKKPVVGSAQIYRGGVLQTAGAGAGQYALDTTTGIVTFVADASSNATSVTPGATTQVVLTTNPGTLVATQKLYLSGFTGTDAALLNGLAHTINSVAGTGPYTFTLAVSTTAVTLGSGSGKKYPQVSEILTWAGEFDVPVRFDSDQMKTSIDAYSVYSWGNIVLIEVRT